MRITSRWTRAAAVTAVLALALAACGGGDDEPAAPPPAEEAEDDAEDDDAADDDAADDDADDDASDDDGQAADVSECESGIQGRIAHHLADTVVGHQGFVAMAEEVADRTDGRISLEVFPAGQLGGIAEWADLLRDGAIEIAWVATSILGAFAPDISATDLPFLFETDQQFHDVMDSDIGDDINALILERAGVEILGWSSVGALYPFFGGVDPVTTPDDLQGVRIRTAEAPVAIRTWELLGAEPLPMALGDVYTALQTGAVDAYNLPYWATRATSLYEVSDRMSELPVQFSNLGIGVDPAWLAGLCDADAEVIRSAAANAATFNREGWPQSDLEDREYLIGQGIEMVPVPDIGPFRELVQPQWDDFEAESETDIFARIRAQLGL